MARAALEAHVVWQVDRLHERESRGDRDFGRVLAGVFLALGFGYPTIWLFEQPSWWRWLGLVTLFLAVAGLGAIQDGLQVIPRQPGRRRRRSVPDADATADGATADSAPGSW